MDLYKLLNNDVYNILNTNTNKLKLLYIDLFKAKQTGDIISTSNGINYIRSNNDVLDLICKTRDIDNIHEYKMLTDLDYRFKHMKMNNNVCPNCKTHNIIYDDQKTCIDCGSVLGNVNVTSYNQRDN